MAGFRAPLPHLGISAPAVVTQAGYRTALPSFQGGAIVTGDQAGYVTPLPLYGLGAGIAEAEAQRGGAVSSFEIIKGVWIDVETPEPIDVSTLEVLVSAMSGDLKTMKGQLIKEADLRRVEEEVLLMLEYLLNDSL